MVLAIMISNQCNFHCGHCMVESTRQFNLISRQVTDRFLEILSLKEADSVYIIGGEPTLHMDYVEQLIGSIREFCNDILIFTNGSFLLNPSLAERVRAWNVRIRISNDRYHRKFWTPALEEAIVNSGYHIEARADDYEMIPVGRAYEEFKDLQYHMGCSLINGRYDERYPNHHRYMVMPDGRVNLYCAAIEASLANVFEDPDICYALLEHRERILHNYLIREVIHSYEDTFMGKLCNECPHYKVTSDEILYKGTHVAWNKDYAEGFEDLYQKFVKDGRDEDAGERSGM